MEELITDYLIHIHHYLVVDGSVLIVRIEPFIQYDEQHYLVKVRNVCLESGCEEVPISMSSLLVFLFKRGNV